MSDYIDRQAALEAIEAEREYMTRRQEWLAEHILTHCGYRIIEDLPSADVEPVRHGRWIFSPSHSEGTCTYCSGKIYGRPYNNTYVIVPYKYCPNCGARMDGEEDEQP